MWKQTLAPEEKKLVLIKKGLKTVSTNVHREIERTKKQRKKDKVNKNLKRKLETAEEKCEQHLLDKVLTAKRRKVEIPEHKAQRLQAQKLRTNAHRQLETAEKTVHRLREQKVRTASNRKLETAAKTVHRLQGQKVRTTTNRKLETAEQTAQRKLRDKVSTANKRKMEIPEQTAQRKFSDKISKAGKRYFETLEQTVIRRKVQRGITAKNKKSKTQQEKAKLNEKERERLAQSRNTADDISEITRLFQKKVQSGPDFVCTCCHRIMYRQTVKLYDKGKYPKLSEEEYRTLLEPYIYTSIDGNTWICVTCDRSLCRGKMPKQAKANNLMLD